MTITPVNDTVTYKSARGDADTVRPAELVVAVNKDGTSVGPLASTVDAGAVTGSALTRYPTASVFNRLSVGVDTLRFSDYFNATAQNTARWKTATNLFTFGFGTAGYNVFNNSSITTTAAAQILMSWPTFSMMGGQPLMFEFSEYRTNNQATNQQFEAGMFLANIAAAPYTPTDGVYFRFTSTGLIGVLNYNGVENTIALLTAAQVTLADNTTYRIVMNHYRVEFWGASGTSNPRILLGVLPVPAANGPPFASLNLPIAFRLYNSGTAGSVVQAQVANTVVVSQDLESAIPPGDVSAGMAMMPYQGDNGDTMGSTALYTNSMAAAPAGAAMTNTAAALGTGFGGRFSVQPTLAAGTDGIVMSFQNPAPTVNATGNTLFIKGIRIQGLVTTALTGGPVLYAFSIAFGHSAVSMATAEAAATKAPRRKTVGYETYSANATVGTLGSAGIYMSFAGGPIAVMAGEFFAVVANNLGTVTSAGVISLLVSLDAYEV